MGKLQAYTPSVFGQKLRLVRLSKGITQKQISEKCSISPGLITQFEHGDSLPTDEIAKRLADFLKCSVDDLMDDRKTI